MRRSSPVKVCVRTRPSAFTANCMLSVDSEAQTICLRDGQKFQVHRVLHNVGQEKVYDGLARDVVQGALDGVNGTIMSYGQTGRWVCSKHLPAPQSLLR
jgi:hypothetical protein